MHQLYDGPTLVESPEGARSSEAKASMYIDSH